MNNLFACAIEKNELLDFGLGTGPYFIPDRSYDASLHWALASWQQHILPYIKCHGSQQAAGPLAVMLGRLFAATYAVPGPQAVLPLWHLDLYYSYSQAWHLPTSGLLDVEAQAVPFLQEYLAILAQYDPDLLLVMEDFVKRLQAKGALQSYQPVNREQVVPRPALLAAQQTAPKQPSLPARPITSITPQARAAVEPTVYPADHARKERLDEIIAAGRMLEFFTGQFQFKASPYADMPMDVEYVFDLFKSYYAVTGDADIWRCYRDVVLEVSESPVYGWTALYYASYIPDMELRGNQSLFDSSSWIRTILANIQAQKSFLMGNKRWGGAHYANGLWDDVRRLLWAVSAFRGLNLRLE